MTLRVLFVAPAYPTEAEPVAGIFYRTQAVALRDAGLDVAVTAPSPWVPPGFQSLRRWRAYAAVPRHYEMDGLSIARPRCIRWPRGNFWAAPHRAIQTVVRKTAARPDVVHAHAAYPCGLAAVGLSRMWRIPSVLTLHGSDVNHYPEVNALSRRRFRAAVLGSAEVIAVSRALAQRTQELTGRLPRVMPIGIDVRRYDELPRKDEARRTLGLPPGQAIVLYVGHLSAAKGVGDLLGALEMLQKENVLGLFIGDGPLRTKSRDTPNARFVGAVGNESVRRYMAAADVLALPSYSEGMPTVLIEAAAAGLPIVASAVGGIPELLADGGGCLIRPGATEEIARGIQRVLADRVTAAERANRLRAHVHEAYDVRQNVRRLTQLYDILLHPEVSARPSAAEA